MTGGGPGGVQRAIDFLVTLEPDDVDWASLPAGADYGAIARLAGDRGVDASAVLEAFKLIMQARLLAAAPRCPPPRGR
ncbi:MAG: hypothetical protein ACJ8DZ_06120 [Allosphingosinicella sp.]